MPRNLETVQALYRAFSQGDIATIGAHMAPDVQWESWGEHTAQRAGVPWLARRNGPEGVQAFFATLAAHLQIIRFEVQDLLASDHQVAVAVSLEAQCVGTQRRFSDEELHLWTFDTQGRVNRLRHYCDTAKHIAAAGLAA